MAFQISAVDSNKDDKVRDAVIQASLSGSLIGCFITQDSTHILLEGIQMMLHVHILFPPALNTSAA